MEIYKLQNSQVHAGHVNLSNYYLLNQRNGIFFKYTQKEILWTYF